MSKRVEIDEAIRPAKRPYEEALVAPEYHPLCRVKWPEGGWIFWNWKTASWDDVADIVPAIVRPEDIAAALRAAKARGETHVEEE